MMTFAMMALVGSLILIARRAARCGIAEFIARSVENGSLGARTFAGVRQILTRSSPPFDDGEIEKEGRPVRAPFFIDKLAERI